MLALRQLLNNKVVNPGYFTKIKHRYGIKSSTTQIEDMGSCDPL